MLVRKTIIWAILWTIIAIGSTFNFLRSTGDKWFDVVLSLASFYLAFTFWIEVRQLYRQTRQS